MPGNYKLWSTNDLGSTNEYKEVYNIINLKIRYDLFNLNQ